MATYTMTEADLETTLGYILADFSTVALYDDPESRGAPALVGCTVETFADAGLMTNNRGLVLHLADGRDFQIQIVQQGGRCQ
jgi:hypothetical protein